MQYPVITAVLFAALLLYFQTAKKYNIVDKPNERSSHDYITIRGGGIVFWLAAVLYCLLNFSSFENLLSLCFLIGITLISAVSFWDDIKSLPNKIRIVIHFLSISLVFYGLGMFSMPWRLIPAAYIFFVGILNAYNFMDGINGITGLYSLAVLILLQYTNYKLIPFTNPGFINYAIIACMVFLFFNFRKKAKCFAGDVGSMAVSFWLVALLLQLMLKTGSFIWILFLAVYGVDSVFTILHRLYLKQNIFQAHRMHFYQILSNERGISHLKVSAGYALVQLLIGGFIIQSCRINMPEWLAGLSVAFVLSTIYLLKFRK